MNSIELMIKKYFDRTNVQINMEDVIKVLTEYNISENELDIILLDIKNNLSFFEYKFANSYNGIFISNLISYAFCAVYVPKSEWTGSWGRNRITSEYKSFRELKSNEDSEINYTNSELNSLVGLENIKEEVRALTSLASVRKKKINFGIPVLPNSLHMVFTGNPGTGKTTVARLIGSIYKSLGLLKSGHVIETSRKDLIGQYIGHTAPLVEKKFKEAEDGILFIDEAYSITSSKGTHDFGSEAIQTLIKLMEDDRHNTVVIVAGYPAEMKTFINSNPGLESRFSTYINFEDYTTEQLLLIFKLFIQRDEHILTDAAAAKIQFIMEENFGDQGNEGNARFIRNLYGKVQKKQAERLSKMQLPSKYDLSTITDEDIPNAL